MITEALPTLLIGGCAVDKARGQLLYIKCLVAVDAHSESTPNGNALSCGVSFSFSYS